MLKNDAAPFSRCRLKRKRARVKGHSSPLTLDAEARRARTHAPAVFVCQEELFARRQRPPTPARSSLLRARSFCQFAQMGAFLSFIGKDELPSDVIVEFDSCVVVFLHRTSNAVNACARARALL